MNDYQRMQQQSPSHSGVFSCAAGYQRAACPPAMRPGMTLLEVMLALSLTGVVLVAISMAIDLHLRMLDARRNDVERVQLARAVLQIIAKDLRSAVEPCTTDFSALASMAVDAAASGSLPEMGDALAGSSESAGGAASGSGFDASMAADELGQAADALLGGDDATSGTSSGDIAASSEPSPVPGLYGNQYELQVDVGRIPRVDEMQQLVAASLVGPLQDIPSDVKTVAYYLYNPESGSTTGDFRDAAGNPQTGLVRRVLDRAVTLYAASNTNVTSLQQAGEVIAPEIASIEFQYFDGLEWLYEWDSDTSGGLPVAVRITIVMMPDGQQSSLPSSVYSADQQVTADQIYSLVVRLPTALPCEPTETTESTDSSGMEAVGL